MGWKAGETAVAELAAGPWCLPDEDAELVAALGAGSADAFDQLISRYHASLYNLVYRMVGEPGEAADAVQDIFLKVFRGLGEFRSQSSLKTWIFRIAVHESSNRRRWWRRHRSRETSLEAPMKHEGGQFLTLSDVLVEEGSSPFEQAVSKEIRRAVDRALAELPEPYRTAVLLRDLEEFSYEEIAEVLQVSVGTVKSRLARGRQALKSLLTSLLAPASAVAPVRAAQPSGSAVLAGPAVSSLR